MKPTVVLFLTACVLGALPPVIAAQEVNPAGNGAAPVTGARPGVRAGLLRGEIHLDGVLDEAAWADAPVASGFIQATPLEGEPAENDTDVRVLVGEDALYVAAELHDREPGLIEDRLVRRDEEGTYDWFSVQLDPNRDRRTAYTFRVSASNVQRDEYIFNDNRGDAAWNAVWESAVRKGEDGWSVEVRIPLSQIRYEASTEPRTWGVNFVRRRNASNELSYFSLKSRLIEGRVSQFGRLEDVRVPRPARRIEARPYVLSSLHDGPADPGDPFFDGSQVAARAGVDLRFGLGSAFTLDATLNPDFGQVEADPAVINLSAFETFFKERRPFFVEDAQILDFSLSGHQDKLFYSRRIGRSPQGGAPPGSAFSEVPGAATILGATKVTGRTEGGLSIGALGAVTQAETGRAVADAESPITEFMAEPRAEYGVVRVQQDFNEGASQIGGIVTAMRRDLPSGGEFDRLASSAFSAGVSFEHQWANRTWSLNGFFVGSHVRGDPTAMVRLQRASNHYFQRPDATRLRVDSAATSLTGAQWRLQLDKQNGKHWTGGVWLAQVTPGFEINDLGFSQARERLDGGVRVGYREIRPGTVFRSYSLTFFTFQNWSHEALDDVWSLDSWSKAHTAGTFSLNNRFELLNYWGGSLDLALNANTMSRTATRGGPLMVDPGSFRTNLRFTSDRRKSVILGGGVSWTGGFADAGDDFSLSGSLQVRPSGRLDLKIEPRWSLQSTASQYVTSTSTLEYEPTFGRRYLFAELDRTTLSMEARVNLSVSPTLTFQLFAQPLLSSGDYVRYRQLAAPGTFDFVDFEPGMALAGDDAVTCAGGAICQAGGVQYVDFDGDGAADYSFGDRDFNVRSLVGNAVLRWEYRPGSTVFLVWQRRQAGRASVGDFDFGRDLASLWDVPADNRFIVKFNYWLGL